MHEDKVEAINPWPFCRIVLQSYRQWYAHIRCFVKDFSLIAAPFFRLIKKGDQ